MAEDQAILALIARLEAATEPSRALDAAIGLAVGVDIRPFPGGGFYVHNTNPECDSPVLAYTRSLDAALTLVPEHWRWLLDKRPWGEQRQDGFRAEVYLPAHSYRNDRSDVPTHWGPSSALALCIAALKARAAQTDG